MCFKSTISPVQFRWKLTTWFFHLPNIVLKNESRFKRRDNFSKCKPECRYSPFNGGGFRSLLLPHPVHTFIVMFVISPRVPRNVPWNKLSVCYIEIGPLKELLTRFQCRFSLSFHRPFGFISSDDNNWLLKACHHLDFHIFLATWTIHTYAEISAVGYGWLLE